MHTKGFPVLQLIQRECTVWITPVNECLTTSLTAVIALLCSPVHHWFPPETLHPVFAPSPQKLGCSSRKWADVQNQNRGASHAWQNISQRDECWYITQRSRITACFCFVFSQEDLSRCLHTAATPVRCAVQCTNPLSWHSSLKEWEMWVYMSTLTFEYVVMVESSTHTHTHTLFLL